MTTTWSDRLRAVTSTAPDPGGPVVVVSAHPDDEVIGLGAWLAGQTLRDVLFVVATDGEASHPGSPTISPDELRDVRRRELADALAALGHTRPRVAHLGLPDTGLDTVVDELVPLLRDAFVGAALVLAPYEHDGHADHDAAGRAALEAADGIPVWRYPVWTFDWTTPEVDHWLARAAILPSPSGGRTAKEVALGAFRSQVAPLSDHPADRAVVTPGLLAHAITSPEVVLT